MSLTASPTFSMNVARIGAMPGAMAGMNFAKVNERQQKAQSGTLAALNTLQGTSGGDDELGLMDVNRVSVQRPTELNHASIAGIMGINAAAKTTDPTVEQKEKQANREKQVTEYAQQLVSQVFYGTMLKQMRESPFKSELFSGGRGGQAYSALFDQTLSEKASKASGNKLTRAIARSILKKDSARADAMNGQLPTPAALVPDAASAVKNSFENVRVHVAPNLGR